MASPEPGSPYQAPGARIPAHWQTPGEDPPTIKWWQKALMVLGAIFLVLIILAAVATAASALMGKNMDRESQAYVDQVVPIIVANWDARALQERGSTEFAAVAKPGELEKLFTYFSRLGKMKTYLGSRGRANVFFTTQGRVISAEYQAKADFEAGPADIYLVLVKREGQWQITGFRINSQALMH